MLLAERMFSGCGKDRVVAMLRRVRFLYAIAPVTDDAGSAAEERSGTVTIIHRQKQFQRNGRQEQREATDANWQPCQVSSLNYTALLCCPDSQAWRFAKTISARRTMDSAEEKARCGVTMVLGVCSKG